MLQEAADTARGEAERLGRELAEAASVREALERDVGRVAAELAQVGMRQVYQRGGGGGCVLRGGGMRPCSMPQYGKHTGITCKVACVQRMRCGMYASEPYTIQDMQE